jgi:hypothetical protein
MRVATGVNESSARTVGNLPRGAGLSGKVVVSFAAAGGVLVGGFLVAAMTLAGKLSGNALLLTSTSLFVVGTILGLAHGTALAWFGRPLTQTRRETLGAIGLGVLYSVIGGALAWLVSGWIALTTVALYLHRVFALAGVAVAWVVGALIVAVAFRYGWQALRNAYERWPERKLGTALVAATFGALLVTFFARQPVLWGTTLMLNATGALLLAGFLTLWVGGPVISVGLMAIRRLPLHHPPLGLDTGVRAIANIALGVGLGILLGVIALPFYGNPYNVPTPQSEAGVIGTLLLGTGQALMSEVLLRLFVVTAAALMFFRWYRFPPRAAALLAIAVSAFVQLALYLPAAVAVGFPNLLVGVAYILAAAFIPAIVLGTLYWRRGFGTALMADATAMATVLLIAA